MRNLAYSCTAFRCMATRQGSAGPPRWHTPTRQHERPSWSEPHGPPPRAVHGRPVARSLRSARRLATAVRGGARLSHRLCVRCRPAPGSARRDERAPVQADQAAIVEVDQQPARGGAEERVGVGDDRDHALSARRSRRRVLRRAAPAPAGAGSVRGDARPRRRI